MYEQTYTYGEVFPGFLIEMVIVFITDLEREVVVVKVVLRDCVCLSDCVCLRDCVCWAGCEGFVDEQTL